MTGSIGPDGVDIAPDRQAASYPSASAGGSLMGYQGIPALLSTLRRTFRAEYRPRHLRGMISMGQPLSLVLSSWGREEAYTIRARGHCPCSTRSVPRTMASHP